MGGVSGWRNVYCKQNPSFFPLLVPDYCFNTGLKNCEPLLCSHLQVLQMSDFADVTFNANTPGVVKTSKCVIHSS